MLFNRPRSLALIVALLIAFPQLTLFLPSLMQ